LGAGLKVAGHLAPVIIGALKIAKPRLALVAWRGKKAATISEDLFKVAVEYRKSLGTAESAFKKNIAILKFERKDKSIGFIKAINQGRRGAHGEEMAWAEFEEVKSALRKMGDDAKPLELFSERVPCSNCTDIIINKFGDIDVFYLAGKEQQRWKSVRDFWKYYGIE
jgi:hypothetical protein